MNIKILQLHKRASIYYHAIQDKFSIGDNCIALSDGTTQSFKSEVWAEKIVKNFTENPTLNIESFRNELIKQANEFSNISFQFNSNFAIASIEKKKKENGGTATFLGIQFESKNKLNVINCGDSVLFIIRGNKIISFPFKSLEELDKNQDFLNSSKLLQEGTVESSINSNAIVLETNDKIILATDAISRMIFTKPDVIAEITSITNFEELKFFCETNWKNNSLEEDDISIIIVDPFSNEQSTLHIIPPEDFSFPKEEEKKFVYNEEFKTYKNESIKIEMEQLNKITHVLYNEINNLKKRLALSQTLLISCLIILTINSFLLFYILISKKNSNVDKYNLGVQKSEAFTEEEIKTDDKSKETYFSNHDKNKANTTNTKIKEQRLSNREDELNTKISAEKNSDKQEKTKLANPDLKVLKTETNTDTIK